MMFEKMLIKNQMGYLYYKFGENVADKNTKKLLIRVWQHNNQNKFWSVCLKLFGFWATSIFWKKRNISEDLWTWNYWKTTNFEDVSLWAILRTCEPGNAEKRNILRTCEPGLNNSFLTAMFREKITLGACCKKMNTVNLDIKSKRWGNDPLWEHLPGN